MMTPAQMQFLEALGWCAAVAAMALLLHLGGVTM